MMSFDNIEQIIEFAIGEEEKAARFYTELAEKVPHKNMKEVFLGFAEEEKGHKAKLLGVKEGRLELPEKKKVTDLKIADYLVDVDPSEDFDYQKALIIAMKAEKAAFRLYQDLAGQTDIPEMKELFLRLAQEEAKHKLRFEIEYDDEILKED
ncbi:MAG: ferritin family protein [Candidatus Krumholzibacteriota bacterium]|nr:ferritin family protein [Candidatus Krumholzibacteriota bacterium]